LKHMFFKKEKPCCGLLKYTNSIDRKVMLSGQIEIMTKSIF
jgi:hypothetical protein